MLLYHIHSVISKVVQSIRQWLLLLAQAFFSLFVSYEKKAEFQNFSSTFEIPSPNFFKYPGSRNNLKTNTIIPSFPQYLMYAVTMFILPAGHINFDYDY